MYNTALTPESVVVTTNTDVTIVEMPLNPVRIKRRLAAVWNVPAKALEQVTIHTEGFSEPHIFLSVSLPKWRQSPNWFKGTINAKSGISESADSLTVSLSLSQLEEQERQAAWLESFIKA